MRLVTPEFGHIDRKRLGPRLLAQLRRLDQPPLATNSPIFDWNDIRWLRVQNYVGIIQVPGLTLEILPKVGSPTDVLVDPPAERSDAWARAQRNLLYMLTVSGILPFEERDLASQLTARMPFFEALLAVFSRRLLLNLRMGIDRAYVHREENLPVLRGKLRMSDHVRMNVVRRDRVYVEYDDFVADTLLNRILKATCHRLLPKAMLASTQQRLRECLIEFGDIEDIRVTADCFSAIHLNRNNERFAPLLAFCRLIWLGLSPQMGRGDVKSFSLLFPMEKVFEQFIGRTLVRCAEQFGITRRQVVLQAASKGRYLVYTPEGRGRFLLRPDVRVLRQDNSVSTVLDTKWKRLKGDVEDSKNGVAQSDMYQLFAYAHRYQSADNVLLYPAAPGITAKEYRTDDENGGVRRLRVAMVNLDRDLIADRNEFVCELKTLLSGADVSLEPSEIGDSFAVPLVE